MYAIRSYYALDARFLNFLVRALQQAKDLVEIKAHRQEAALAGHGVPACTHALVKGLLGLDPDELV